MNKYLRVAVTGLLLAWIAAKQDWSAVGQAFVDLNVSLWLAAVGLLIPVVHSGKFATLTWASNGVGLVLAVLLVTVEWLARGHSKTIATPGGANAPAR